MRSFLLLSLIAAVSVLAHGNGQSRGPAGSTQLRIGESDSPVHSARALVSLSGSMELYIHTYHADYLTAAVSVLQASSTSRLIVRSRRGQVGYRTMWTLQVVQDWYCCLMYQVITSWVLTVPSVLQWPPLKRQCALTAHGLTAFAEDMPNQ